MMNKETNFISAIVYVHNNENNIDHFFTMLYNQLVDTFTEFEIIFVNDKSIDDSLNIIEKVAETFQHTSVTILNMSYFHGIELAMNAGVDYSIGDFVFEFDTVAIDYNPELIFDIYKKSLTGFDIVSASPNRKQKKTSSLFYKVFDKYTFNVNQMQTETFRILSRRVINRTNAMNSTIPYRKAVYANCGLDLFNIKYEQIKLIEDDIVDKKVKEYRNTLAVNSLILFTDVGYKFSIIMTELMMVMTLLVAIYTIIIFIIGIPVAGWTTTMLFLAFAFFGLFGILTIIIKYLSILVDLVFKKQLYRISDIKKVTK